MHTPWLGLEASQQERVQIAPSAETISVSLSLCLSLPHPLFNYLLYIHISSFSFVRASLPYVSFQKFFLEAPSMFHAPESGPEPASGHGDRCCKKTRKLGILIEQT
jgi:hypothetical protein